MTEDHHKPHFEFTHNDALPDLMELSFFVPQGADENSFLLGAETRFGTMTVQLDDYEKVIEFGLSSAVLRLELQGCEMGPQKRFGDETPQALKTKVTTRQVDRSSGKVSIGTGVSVGADVAKGVKGSVAAEAGAKKQSSRESETIARQAFEQNRVPVMALSGNRWKFSAVSSDFLRSKYSGDEALCAITTTSNSVHVIGRLSFYPRDLFLIEGNCGERSLFEIFSKKPTKEALAKVLLAKYLRGLDQGGDAGGGIHGSKVILRGAVRE